MNPEIVALIVTVAKAAGEALPALLAMLTDDGREAVLDALARDRAALDGAPDTLAVVTAQIEAARSRARAHTQATAETTRAHFRLVDTTRTVLASLALSPALSHEERSELAIAETLVRAALEGDVGLVHRDRSLLHPPTLPLALFGEPDHPED